MPTRTASARWDGTLKDGSGTMALGSGAYEGAYSFASRFEEGAGTNPEELIGAAHAGCFSMALSAGLSSEGHTPKRVSTEARVELQTGDEGPKIARIRLITEAEVPGIDEATFQEFAESAKNDCPVSKALAGTTIELEATLVG